MRLFWVKMISRIIFPQIRMFGCNGKWNFSEIHFMLTEIYAFDPEMNLHSHFHFNSFPEREREREKGREKRESPDRRERERKKRLCRRSRRSSEDCTPRRSRRSSNDRTDLASDLAFTARSHLLLRRMISIWQDLMNFFAGFCFFCEWVWNWFIICMFIVEAVYGKLGM